MRKPSSRVIRQACMIYPATQGQDTSGGVQFTYSSSAARMVACSAQPHEYEEVYENDRITQYRSWVLMFENDPFVRPRDKLAWIDSANITHIGFAQTSRDEAGRGMAYSVRVTEKL